MEEIKLPAVPELSLIPIERRNFPEADRKQEKQKMLNAVMAVIIYILQAGPI